MKTLDDLTNADLRGVRAVLTDIDDTLTHHGQLPAVAYAAMEQLQQSGIAVIPITGRPAGWCDLIARLWPVEAIVGENGAFYFRYDRKLKKMQRVYAQDATTRAENSKRLTVLAEQVLYKFPGTALASDQAYREVDVAIDFCEDVAPLSLAEAEAIAAMFQRAGAEAKVSSIHVNAWFGSHDKLSMSLTLLAALFGWDADEARRSVAYCGDSPNDGPMFGFFPLGIGVANIKPFLPMMAEKPAYMTKAEGGLGFSVFTQKLLALRH